MGTAASLNFFIPGLLPEMQVPKRKNILSVLACIFFNSTQNKARFRFSLDWLMPVQRAEVILKAL